MIRLLYIMAIVAITAIATPSADAQRYGSQSCGNTQQGYAPYFASPRSYGNTYGNAPYFSNTRNYGYSSGYNYSGPNPLVIRPRPRSYSQPLPTIKPKASQLKSPTRLPSAVKPRSGPVVVKNPYYTLPNGKLQGKSQWQKNPFYKPAK